MTKNIKIICFNSAHMGWVGWFVGCIKCKCTQYIGYIWGEGSKKLILIMRSNDLFWQLRLKATEESSVPFFQGGLGGWTKMVKNGRRKNTNVCLMAGFCTHSIWQITCIASAVNRLRICIFHAQPDSQPSAQSGKWCRDELVQVLRNVIESEIPLRNSLHSGQEGERGKPKSQHPFCVPKRVKVQSSAP